MSRMSDCFDRLANENRKALIPYIVAGDPEPKLTVTMMHEMVDSGADIIELGVPFSDPEAEGAVIQLAHERALIHNTSLRDTCEFVAEFRKKDKLTPVLLMGYVNPIEKMGYETFAQLAALSGVDAILIVNMPPEEGELLDQSLIAHGIDNICLIAPTTTDKRANFLRNKSRGFTYYVSLKGTTGASTLNLPEVEARVASLRQYSDLPLVVGFGIKNGEIAAAVSRFADGSVVGSAIVKLFGDYQNDHREIIKQVKMLLTEMRVAMDENEQ